MFFSFENSSSFEHSLPNKKSSANSVDPGQTVHEGDD